MKWIPLQQYDMPVFENMPDVPPVIEFDKIQQIPQLTDTIIFGKSIMTGKEYTCRVCINRQRTQCNSKVFQYCKVRKSKRTANGLLKIKCKDVACNLFKSEEDEI